MDAHNLLFWASGVLGAGALIAIVVGKLTGGTPAQTEHPVSDLPVESD